MLDTNNIASALYLFSLGLVMSLLLLIISGMLLAFNSLLYSIYLFKSTDCFLLSGVTVAGIPCRSLGCREGLGPLNPPHTELLKVSLATDSRMIKLQDGGDGNLLASRAQNRQAWRDSKSHCEGSFG